jgi:small subunit ribosomal protein S20
LPVIRSAKKRLRQSRKRQVRNQAVRSACKTEVRKAREGIAAGAADVGERIRQAQSTLARGASKGVIPKNQAARRLSRIAKQAARPAAGTE